MAVVATQSITMILPKTCDTKASSKNEGSFIAKDDEEYSDDAVGAVDLESSPVPSVQVGEQIWNGLLERAKAQGNLRENMQLVDDSSYDLRLLDHAPELWTLSCFILKPGWEDIVVFHIGRCAPAELHIRAAFITPYLDDRQVWLEVEMSWALKAWLVDIPGMVWRNQQVQICAVEPEESWCALRYTPLLPMVNAHRFSFSQIAIASEIGNQTMELFDGLFSIRWADIHKEFEVGQYVQITEGEPADRWCGWIQVSEGCLLQLISGSNCDEVEIRNVHPNSVIADILPVGGTHFEASSVHFSIPTSTSLVPWKGTTVLVTAPHDSWHGKTGVVTDVGIMRKKGGAFLCNLSWQKKLATLPPGLIPLNDVSLQHGIQSSPDPIHWCLDPILLGMNFRVQYNGQSNCSHGEMWI
ncbi:hypothetical protein F5146DRAFT_994360 [Armillaria mellea]|nr:hypothetical protein F5146DRAFT_994360 [Armillaria mellea]